MATLSTTLMQSYHNLVVSYNALSLDSGWDGQTICTHCFEKMEAQKLYTADQQTCEKCEDTSDPWKEYIANNPVA